MTKVSDLINRVARELIDENFVRWSKSDHLSYFNDAISSILLIRPDLTRKTIEQNVAAGEYKISLPESAYKLLNVNHFDGYSLAYIDLEELNAILPNWRKKTDEYPERWTRNHKEDTAFFIYPSPNKSANIEYDFSEEISALDIADDFPLKQIYEVMVFDFMMYRAYSKDGQDSTELEKANSHYQAFTLSLTGKVQADQQVSTPPKEIPLR
ncbi:phage adaptor protein [Vibrio salinus]|uniref:phage adaptor protein n=1 Tax=Vibrio salinus TaxID=2899784 RepID=UPI001E3F2A34|nr:DUF6682 family protein [Vibrio salinus]MCE0495774.1 hypothetical protein [Vibrio salinus]